jgi:hypothetical protein
MEWVMARVMHASHRQKKKKKKKGKKMMYSAAIFDCFAKIEPIDKKKEDLKRVLVPSPLFISWRIYDGRALTSTSTSRTPSTTRNDIDVLN